METYSVINFIKLTLWKKMEGSRERSVITNIQVLHLTANRESNRGMFKDTQAELPKSKNAIKMFQYFYGTN